MVFSRGELEYRIEKNRERLSALQYCNPKIFEMGGDWDGDWQGRAILSLCCHYRLAQSESVKNSVLSQLNGIIYALDNNTNCDGYFGKVFDNQTCNEQQLSGNSWFLRGLCEYYNITGDKAVLQRLKLITEKLLTQLADFYKKYPLADREEGGVGGHLLRVKIAGWYLSSDIACAYILLDGITAVYDILLTPKLKEAIDTMIAIFIKIDYNDRNCQTHAILSATRGIIRFSKHSENKQQLIDFAKLNFDLYIDKGSTLNFANYNWFGRPYWTEPCAVVDSILVAQQLYEITNDTSYLAFLNCAYVNAIRMCQRKNGGAGCETCLDENNDTLKVHLYEADFCCTMRLSEGLLSLNNFACVGSNGNYTITLLSSFYYQDQFVQIDFDYIFAQNSTIKIEITDKGGCGGKIKIYLPQATTVSGGANTINDGLINLVYKGNTTIQLTLTHKLHGFVRGSLNVNMIGDSVLTEKLFDYSAKLAFNIDGRRLSPILNFIDTEQNVLAENIIQKI